MSVEKCTPGMVEKGEITQEQADRMNATYRDALSAVEGQMSPEAAAAHASEETVRRFAAEAAQAKRQTMLQVAAQQRITKEAESFIGPREKAFAAFIAHDDRAPYQRNVEYHQLNIEGQAHALVQGILAEHSRNMAGQVRNRAQLRDVLREAFGENSGDAAAKELAQSWGKAAEMLRTRFNQAGGAIGKMENWGLPQTHNTERVRSVPFEEWRAFIFPLLDRTKMLDQSTGLAMSPQQVESALDSIYRKVRSDGWVDRKPGTFSGSGKLANRHADERFLTFKNADAWMEYNQQFGRPLSRMGEALDPDGIILDAMTGHISSMSRDIALTEVLGPNPTATVKWMTDTMMKAEWSSTDTGMKGVNSAKSESKRLNDLYAEVAGKNETVYTKAGLVFSNLKALQVSSKLGSAMLSATTDMGFQHLTRRFNGIPAAKQIASYAKMLNPASAADRELAIRSGLIAREAAKRAVQQSRWTEGAMGGETAARLNELTMRASGLSAWTQGGQWAFGMDFLGHISHVRGQAYDTLAPAFRRTLERYGIDSGIWDNIRSTPLEDQGGSRWIMPHNMEQRVQDRVMRMILAETDFAVPNVTLATRAMFAKIPKGTLPWEIIRSPLVFKTFSASVMMTHGHRMMQHQAYSKLRYAAGLAVSTGLLGGLAMQLQAVSRGQDPVPMEDPVFWAQALFQGGGLSILGDFLKASTDRNLNDIATSIAGPVASDITGVVRVAREGWKSAKGDDNHLGAAALKQIKADLPGSSLWYGKLAFQREVMDQLQREIDPHYDESFSRLESYAQQQGTEFYWRPGDTSPTRGPDLTNATKAPPPQ